MERLAVLDLGSNSFHVLVADIGSDGTIDPIIREREMLHLSREVTRTGQIVGDALERSVEVAGRLAALAGRSGATELHAVATSAIRDAGNRDGLLQHLSGAVGVEVQLLTGTDEARLSYIGARASVAVDASSTLVLDLGGGSLEIVLGDDSGIRWAVSLPLGATRLAAEHASHDPLRTEDLDRIRGAVAGHLAGAVDLDVAPGAVIVLGGAVRALARVHHDGWLPQSVNMVPFVRDELQSLAERLCALDEPGRAELEPNRSDHIHVAALTLATVAEVLQLEGAHVSDWGLREGVLLRAKGIDAPPNPHELRRRGVQMLVESFDIDRAHSEHVAAMAAVLFDATRGLHGYDSRAGELLDAGARLHDIGRAVALKHHERHGSYLVEQAGLRGYAPWEVAVIATLIRCHNTDGPKTSFPPYRSLDPERQRLAARLLALLQLADSLDRPRDQALRNIDVAVRGDMLHLTLLDPITETSLPAIRRQAQLFESTFEHRVEIIDRAGAR